ncbi:MAG: hypothetical protein ACI4IQ_02300, partial [Eubacterium sp.]
MKTRISKRILSVILSVLMVVTSIPLMAFTAYADDLSDLDSAMTSYETKIKDGKVYTNMSAAYTAYVNCMKARDAYVYGNQTTTDLASRTSALNTAIANMTEVTTYKTGTWVASSDGDSIPANTAAESRNILYTPQMTGSAIGGTITLSNSVTHNILMGSTVVLRDGITTPTIPIMHSGRTNTSGKTRYIYGIYPTSSPAAASGDASLSTAPVDHANVKFEHNWCGNLGTTVDFGWSIAQTVDNPGYNAATAYGSNQSTSTRSQAYPYSVYVFPSLKYYTYYLANVLSVPVSTTRSSISFTPNWFVASADGVNSGINDCGIIGGLATIYVVNYALLINAVKAAAVKFNDGTYNITDYEEGGLAELMQAIDDAVAFDPNSYFSSFSSTTIPSETDLAAAVTSCSDAMDARIAALNVTPAADTYECLRDTMNEEMRNVYRVGNDDGTYDSNAWNAFAIAYRAAQSTMALPINNSNGYADTTVATQASDLATAYEALKASMIVEKVDTTELEALMNEIWGYYQIFTPDTYNAAIAAVQAADTAVWQSVYDSDNPENNVANFGVDSMKPNASDEATALVQSQIDAINAAKANLRVSMDTTYEVVNNVYYSMNNLTSIYFTLNNSDYSNWATYDAAYKTAIAYTEKAATTEFTDFDTQFQEYKDAVTALYNAYIGLKIAFTKIADGTLAGTGSVTYSEASSSNSLNDKNTWGVTFTAPQGSIVIRTSHEAKSYPYGKATILFEATPDGYDSHLDSINIQDPDTATQAAEITSKSGSNSAAMSDTQKATYPGGLTAAVTGSDSSSTTVSLKNIVTYSKQNNGLAYYGKTEDGTEITELGFDITNALGTTNGTDGPVGTIAARANNKANGSGKVTAQGDMCIDVPATQVLSIDQLDESTIPSAVTYSVTTNVGGTYYWKHMPVGIQYHGYGHVKAEYTTSVTVIDLANLFTLINYCDTIIDSTPYTEASWNEFQNWLRAAKENIDLTSSTSQNIVDNCTTKYTQLYTAYKGLTLKPVTIAFDYYNANGGLSGYTINGKYGDSLADYVDEFNAIQPPTYTKDGYRYKFLEWEPLNDSPALDFDNPYTLTVNTSYKAVYTSEAIPADFTAYNAKIQELLGMITDKTYSVDALNTINTYLSSLTYYTKTDEEKAAMLWIDHQSVINAEITAINSWILNYFPAASTLDLDAANAQLEDAKTKVDPDIYDASAVTLQLYQSVDIVGSDITVDGIAFANQTQLDKAIDAAISSSNLSIMKYDVYLNGELVGTFDYGTTLEVHGDKSYNTDANTEINKGSTKYAWYYQFESPQVAKTASKFMTTAPSFGFIVKGTTWLTTKDAVENTSGYVVTFVNGVTGKIFDIVHTDASGNFTMSSAPKMAYYTFNSFSNGAAAGAQDRVTADTTIVANYDVNSIETYTINVWSSIMFSWTYYGDPEWTDTYQYNERVELDGVDLNDNYLWNNDYPAVWCELFYDEDTDTTTYRPLYYGCDYVFYACRDIDLVPLTADELLSYATDGMSIDYSGYAMDDTGNVIGTTVQNDIIKVYD